MGIAPCSVERLLRTHQRKNEWESYGMAIATFSAGIWPRERFVLAGLTDSNICQRCCTGTEEDVVEDLIHRYWECPADERIDHQDVKKTQYMAHGEVGAIATGEDWPVLWRRGLCPRAIHPLPPPPEESLTYLEKPFPKERMDCFWEPSLCGRVHRRFWRQHRFGQTTQKMWLVGCPRGCGRQSYRRFNR